ncbi:MAG: hypothetical protein KF775_01760 [Cyclobacteriaceae bacterium]|nr:hypothetical protein [Cyclobacteriaceae bacterium]
MKTLFFIAGLFGFNLVAGQSFTEKISREYEFEKKSADNALVIANISGSILVRGYEGTKIQVEVTRTIRAKTTERLEAGKVITLGAIDLADTVILYTEGLCSKFGRRQGQHGNWGRTKGWGYGWESRGSNCDEKVEYALDFIVRVPYSVNVVVSTVNQGNIKVEDMAGSVIADNVNGNVSLTNISREAVARTVNGNVDVSYSKNPMKPCKFYTLNGDINALFQKGLQAELSFESFNGHFYTNIDNMQSKPAVVEQKDLKDGMKFKVKGNQFRIGAGGAHLSFETFNGNVYLKEKS